MGSSSHTPFLTHLLQRFPEHWNRITALAAEDEGFLGLCEGYRDGVVALQHWEGQPGEVARERAREYRNIVDELEAEILAALVTAARPAR